MLSKLASGAGSVSAESGISSTARPASRARHHPRPLAAHHPKTAGAVDQPGEQEAGVEGGGCGHGRCKAALNGVVCPDSSLRC
jgi:hypothetical protein